MNSGGHTVEPADRHELVRRSNIEHVFRLIGEHGPLTRNEVIKLAGLSKPTVLSLVAALEDEGLIVGVPLPVAGAGRTPTVYQHNPEAAYVVGIDLGGTKVAAGIADLSGRVIAEVEEPTSTAGGDAVVKQLAQLARAVAKEAGIAWSKVDAISVGSPGVVAADGTLDLAANVAGLGSTSLAAELRKLVRTPVAVDNDVNMAALGELQVGVAQKCRTFALVAIGTGLGLGLVVDGQLARGARGGAGEIAYFPIGGDPASPESRRRGTLELAVSGSGVQARLRAELVHRSAETKLTRRSDARAVFAAAADGDPVAKAVVRAQAEVLSRAVLALAALIDPEMVVLGGGIGSNPYLLEPVREEVDRIAPWPVRIETSALGARAGLIGSIHHALLSLPQIESHRVSARLLGGGE